MFLNQIFPRINREIYLLLDNELTFGVYIFHLMLNITFVLNSVK